MDLDVEKVCGDDIISRDAGRKVREAILVNWSEPVIRILLRGKTVASVSFFDEAIGLLMKNGQKPFDEVREKLQFPDLTQDDRNLLNSVIKTRLDEAKTKPLSTRRG